MEHKTFGITADDLRKRPKVLVAVSGGPDSQALWHVLVRLRDEIAAETPSRRVQLGAVHVDYGLRGVASEGDAEHVELTAKRWGCPLYLLRARRPARPLGGSSSSSPQLWARQVRHELFADLNARESWVIALAHHADDVAESAVLRMARGTSLQNWSGMKIEQGHLWRPLLHQSKRQLVEYGEQHGLEVRLDESNASCDYDRNRVRHRVLPELESMYPKASRRIVRLAEDARDMVVYSLRQLKDQHAGQSWAHIARRDRLKTLPTSLAREVLSQALQELSEHVRPNAAVDSSFTTFTTPFLEELLATHEGVWLDLSSGWQVAWGDTKLQLRQQKIEAFSPRFRQYEKALTRASVQVGLSPGCSLEWRVPQHASDSFRSEQTTFLGSRTILLSCEDGVNEGEGLQQVLGEYCLKKGQNLEK